MELKFTNAFKRDRDYYAEDDELFRQIAGKIKEIKKANSIQDVSGLEDIRGRKVFYRFKITSGKTVYRIGMKMLHNTVWLTLIDKDKRRFYKRL